MALIEVPATVEELRAQRTTMRVRSLNDDIEEIHLRLWERDDYRDWFRRIWPSESVEGNHMLDDGILAMDIRKYADQHGFPIAANAKLGSIIHSLNVVKKRYGISRAQLRRQVGNQRVDGVEDDNE